MVRGGYVCRTSGVLITGNFRLYMNSRRAVPVRMLNGYYTIVHAAREAHRVLHNGPRIRVPTRNAILEKGILQAHWKGATHRSVNLPNKVSLTSATFESQ